MPQVQAHAFRYAHSQAVMEGLIAHTKGKALCIRSDYAYVEKPGETVMFQAMLEIAEQGGDDILYVNTVKEFVGTSLSELIIRMHDLLDEIQLPQSFTISRAFSTKKTGGQGNQDFPGMESRGELATFTVGILFRQNASWQGNGSDRKNRAFP